MARGLAGWGRMARPGAARGAQGRRARWRPAEPRHMSGWRARRRAGPKARHSRRMAMRSLVVGSLFAAVLMFIIGFVLMGLLGSAAYTPASPQSAAALQAALRDNLTATGTSAVPDPWTAEGDAAWMSAPAAVLRHVASGAPYRKS